MNVLHRLDQEEEDSLKEPQVIAVSSLYPRDVLLKTNTNQLIVTYFKTKMDYESMFCKYDSSEVKECSCYPQVRVTLLIVTLLALLVDCIGHCRTRFRVKRLEAENETMKSLILTSLDKAFIGIVKNGYESQNEHED